VELSTSGPSQVGSSASVDATDVAGSGGSGDTIHNSRQQLGMVSPEPRRRRLRGKQSGSRIGPRNTLDSFRRREHQHSCPGRAPDNLATIWQQHWRCQPNAAPMALAKSGDVTACHKANLTVSPTCFQRHVDGRRTGLKIRSSQEGVGSSPTFGTDDSTCIARDYWPVRKRRKSHLPADVDG
jgi:hypothetical protein